jgi:hypothetical protein
MNGQATVDATPYEPVPGSRDRRNKIQGEATGLEPMPAGTTQLKRRYPRAL